MEKKARNDNLVRKFCHDPNYHVAADGTIITRVSPQGHVTQTWRTKYPCLNKDGYFEVSYMGHKLRLGRIVYCSWNDQLDDKKIILYRDGNPKNNQHLNLSLLSAGECAEYHYRVLGRKPNRGAAKLTVEGLAQFRADRAKGMSLRKLSKKYGIAKSTCSYIVNGKTYAP